MVSMFIFDPPAQEMYLKFQADLPRADGSRAGEGHYRAVGQVPLNVLWRW